MYLNPKEYADEVENSTPSYNSNGIKLVLGTKGKVISVMVPSTPHLTERNTTDIVLLVGALDYRGSFRNFTA